MSADSDIGIQFVAKMGFEVVAISRGTTKAQLARDLGAEQHIGSQASDPGQALADMGGAQKDSEDTLWFSRITGARPMIETVSLERAADAYSRMMAGDARFRMVLIT